MRFPYGLADFATLISEDYFYVDRTDRIPLIENAGRQLLFLRPRRFGKSLWLSTLENYYDLAKAGDFERLFGKLKIGQNPTPLHNRYFILKLNFSVVDPSGDRDAIRRALFDHLNVRITDVIGRYAEWLGDRVCVLPDNGIASFQSLISVVSQTPYKLYLLIDEYDNFANEVMISRERGKPRYQELVEGEGIIKTFFKAVKDGAEGRGVDRVFITGVSPVVLSDMTSGYNVVKILSHRPEYDDLLGFTADEIQATLEQIAASGMMPTIPVPEALYLIRTFYNGYCFSPRSAVQVYNPTLALYFLEALAQDGEYPAKMLDDNLAMDRNHIQYVARLPHGSTLITQALAADAERPESAILIDQLADRFGVEMMLNTPKDQTFLASLLYYFGVLTIAGRNKLGQLRLTIPNLVVRKLYQDFRSIFSIKRVDTLEY
ncbi:MAG TPA: AAA family ATPase, partial [Candidatus Competibacteraceae bacterium]|nr:AAA family ATPase [Candidatus Competibacteraceae bacterium]HRZ06177.1 AAA family ATPase [Candidatus Competibacteraceae bacterium]